MKSAVFKKVPINPIIVGKIGKTYGFQGWVKLISFTEKNSDIFNYSPWFVELKSQWTLLQLESSRLIKKRYIVKFLDFTNREISMLLTTLNVVVDSTQFPVLCSGEYYWKDIIGCQVITIQGNYIIGNVMSIIKTIAHEVLVVAFDKDSVIRKKNYLIPFVHNKIIKNINLVEKTIIVDWHI